jgi:hypothetical protein
MASQPENTRLDWRTDCLLLDGSFVHTAALNTAWLRSQPGSTLYNQSGAVRLLSDTFDGHHLVEMQWIFPIASRVKVTIGVTIVFEVSSLFKSVN